MILFPSHMSRYKPPRSWNIPNRSPSAPPRTFYAFTISRIIDFELGYSYFTPEHPRSTILIVLMHQDIFPRSALFSDTGISFRGFRCEKLLESELEWLNVPDGNLINCISIDSSRFSFAMSVVRLRQSQHSRIRTDWKVLNPTPKMWTEMKASPDERQKMLPL